MMTNNVVSDDATDRRRRFLVRGTLLVLLAGGGVFVLTVEPPSGSRFYPDCIFHRLTGWHCPGCGVTRALHALLNGDFRQAVAFNAAGFIILPVLAVAIVRSLWAWLWEEPQPLAGPPRRRWLPWVLVAALVLYGVLRNLPGEPFCWLAPHVISE